MAVIVDENEVRKTIGIFKPDGELFEVRIIASNKTTYSGYFDNADNLIKALDRDIREHANCNYYISLNAVNSLCGAREQKDRFLKNPKSTTSDNDIVGYEWLMIDLDPKRPTDTSSTDEQLTAAKNKATKIYDFMRQVGFEKPLIAESGNGVHLLYKVALANNAENKKLVEKCLKVLDMLFSDSEVEIDKKTFNPARVTKLYGTRSQKGLNLPNNPHRLSKLHNPEEEIKTSTIEYLEKLCSYYPAEEKPQAYNNYNPREFDLEQWLSDHGLMYQRTSYSDGYKYLLRECPFDSNHKGKDACVFRGRDGRIGFHCFHNSCSDKTWRDVRLLYEPDAYEKQQQYQDRKLYKNFNRTKPEKKKIVEKDGNPIFLTAQQIFDIPEAEETFIRTGTTEIDKRLRGLAKGDTSLITGLRGAAKSTILTQWVLEAVEAGNNVGVFSGELSSKRFMRWLYLIAAGKSRVKQGKYDGYYIVPKDTMQKINTWLGNHFYLYDNEYGNDFTAITEQFEKAIEEKKLDLLILDNLMALNIKDLDYNKFDAQTQFVLTLVKMAKKHNVHICFVAHPRKAMGFLRLDDVSGSADLANAVDSAFIIHRNNNDFKRLSKQMFGWSEDSEVYNGTNIIEIAKDRSGGTQDVFIPLWYETESKRLKNSLTENKIFSWETDEDGFMSVDELSEIPFEV